MQGGLLFSFSTAVPPGDHLSAGKSAQSLTLCPLVLISAACDNDGRVGLSWSTLLTWEIHGSQLVGGQISVYHRELSGVHCYGQAFACFCPPAKKPSFHLLCSCGPGYQKKLELESGQAEWCHVAHASTQGIMGPTCWVNQNKKGSAAAFYSILVHA